MVPRRRCAQCCESGIERYTGSPALFRALFRASRSFVTKADAVVSPRAPRFPKKSEYTSKDCRAQV
jgi:hypothetical protein